MLYGAHVSSAGGIHTAIDRIEAIGGNCVQVFTQSPRMWRPTNHTDEAVERFRARRREAGVEAVVCHALYLINLASPNPELYAKSVAALRNTVEVACRIEASGVIFHVGSHLGAGFEEGIAHVVPAMEQALEACTDDTWLLMENSAGAGGTIGRSLDELAVLHERLGRHPRLGVCLDSCHLYASGYDVTDPAVVDRIVDELDRSLGIDRVRCLHVNDSKLPLGSNRDRHDNLLEGLLGEGLGAFLAHPAFQGLPAVLEVPGNGDGPTAAEVQKLRELHARWAPGTTSAPRTKKTQVGPRRSTRPTRS